MKSNYIIEIIKLGNIFKFILTLIKSKIIVIYFYFICYKNF